MPIQMTQYDKPYKYVCSYPHHHQCSSTTTHSQRRKGGKWGKVQSAAPWHFHPSHLAACLLTLCSTADYIAQSPAKATAALPHARRDCAAVRPTPCGKAAVSGGAAVCMLALSGSSLLLRAEFHTGAGDQWPQQHCRKGMKKKILYRKTNRVTLIGYSSLKYSEWIHFIHYFILYLQLLLLIEQAIIESWLVNLITYHLGNSSQLHTLFLCRF